MRPFTSLTVCLLCVVYRPVFSAISSDCKTPQFDIRRCYQLYVENSRILSWDEASAACKATGQRLASMETGKLANFVHDSIVYNNSYFRYRVWIGLSRTSDGQTYTWTNGQKFDASQFPNGTLVVSSAPVSYGRLCVYWNSSKLFTFRPSSYCNNSYLATWLCETFRSNIFHLKPVGHVINDVSSGQTLASNTVVSVIDCVRMCKGDWSCQAVSHDGVTCRLHFLQTGHNTTVSSGTTAYERMN